MPDETPGSSSTTQPDTSPPAGNTDVVHTAATAEQILAALKGQGISTLADLVAAMVKKAKEEGGEDDVPDTVDFFIHPHYVLYHDDTHLTDEPDVALKPIQ